jgi:pyridoxal 5'-phosphate synthase pdxS subunit
MASPKIIREIMGAVSIPVMAMPHRTFAEAQILQNSASTTSTNPVLTPADEAHHVGWQAFTVPFVCGEPATWARSLRIAEGAA